MSNLDQKATRKMLLTNVTRQLLSMAIVSAASLFVLGCDSAGARASKDKFELKQTKDGQVIRLNRETGEIEIVAREIAAPNHVAKSTSSTDKRTGTLAPKVGTGTTKQSRPPAEGGTEAPVGASRSTATTDVAPMDLSIRDSNSRQLEPGDPSIRNPKLAPSSSLATSQSARPTEGTNSVQSARSTSVFPSKSADRDRSTTGNRSLAEQQAADFAIAESRQPAQPAVHTKQAGGVAPEPITSTAAGTAQGAVLRGIKHVTVEDTVVGNRENVKEDFAPTLVAESLRRALRNADFAVVDDGTPIHAHIVLDEFSSGSAAKRFVIGMGAGRSTVDGRLVFQGLDGKELASVRIHVRGNLAWSSYQGGNTQRSQAINAFELRLTEEIARLK
jgi:hypothetical protein